MGKPEIKRMDEMKKLIIVLIMFMVSIASAETDITNHQFGAMKVMVINWTAEANGTFIAAETNTINGTVGWVETKPGTTAPTTLYDITLKNNDAYDVMGGKLADRSATLTEGVAPYDPVNDLFVNYPVRGPLTIAITNNSVASATGTITIFYWVY